MSCCGKKRNELRQQRSKIAVKSAESPQEISPQTYFKYVGNSTFTMVGPMSGKLYYFSRPNAIVLVDYRDAFALKAIPALRQLQLSAQ